MLKELKPEILNKLENLRKNLKNMDAVLVAYSGGVDSTFLLKVAFDVLGNKCLAVTAESETYPRRELDEALSVVKRIGAEHLLIQTEELANEQFASNPTDRCYFCKSELFRKLSEIAKQNDFQFVLDGANADDVSDYRPGRIAGKELGVRSPLLEAGLTKEEIRLLSKAMDLPTWDKPSFACLSSRFPYGHRITIEKLSQVDQAEAYLRELGFKQLRVRHHEQIARIEVPRTEFKRMTGELLDSIINELKCLGFVYITLDLEGIRSGSMNEVLKILQ